MKLFGIFIIFIIIIGTLQISFAQTDKSNMDLEVSDEEKIMLFGGFIIAIIVIILFLAKDIILRKKTSYDMEDLESKKDRTYEKYHSDWGEDY
ncbi:MAG: J domain-containing protein, partial [Thaumarchaeota archaeon]|nr:J domain-containing protein [Nitrososphaerota archaeon]